MTERLCSGLVYLLVCLKAYGGAFGIGAVTQYIGAVTALSHNLEEFLGAIGEVNTNREFLKKTLIFWIHRMICIREALPWKKEMTVSTKWNLRMSASAIQAQTEKC